MVEVLKSHQIGSRILDNIDDAKRECVLVTAYIKPWEHLKEALTRAVRRGVSVTAYVREQDGSGARTVQDVASELGKLGVKVHIVPNLHAKIYSFDDKVMIGSMNLYDYSQANSIDFLVQTNDPVTVEATKAFIKEHVEPKAKLIQKESALKTALSFGAKVGVAAANKAISGAKEAASRRLSRTYGHCIRCCTDIPDDIDRPLCKGCYQNWAQYENEEYEENFCLGCGRQHDTTFARPYCRSCYQERK